MDVTELTREQLIELKQAYICETRREASFDDMASADEIVSDDEIFTYYGGVEFVMDDFFCTAGL